MLPESATQPAAQQPKKAIDPKTKGHTRHQDWEKTQKAFIAEHPECLACGCKTHLVAHHIKHFYDLRSAELIEDQLVTLCEHPEHNCHWIFGHTMDPDWKSVNLHVIKDALTYQERRKEASANAKR